MNIVTIRFLHPVDYPGCPTAQPNALWTATEERSASVEDPFVVLRGTTRVEVRVPLSSVAFMRTVAPLPEPPQHVLEPAKQDNGGKRGGKKAHQKRAGS